MGGPWGCAVSPGCSSQGLLVSISQYSRAGVHACAAAARARAEFISGGASGPGGERGGGSLLAPRSQSRQFSAVAAATVSYLLLSPVVGFVSPPLRSPFLVLREAARILIMTGVLVKHQPSAKGQCFTFSQCKGGNVWSSIWHSCPCYQSPQDDVPFFFRALERGRGKKHSPYKFPSRISCQGVNGSHHSESNNFSLLRGLR